MLLTLTNTTSHPPATDLGYLLRKHPDRVHTTSLAFGTASVFYPEARPDRCTAALLVEVDPVALSRGHGDGRDNAPLEPYVNDRPYASSSFLSVAIARSLGSALGGRCDERPELAQLPLQLEAHMPAVPCRGGESLLRRLFEPLGYDITAKSVPLDEAFPTWGPSRFFDVTLRAKRPLSEVLSHLYVLIPVLDDAKHYWVGDDEVQKLLRHGEGWLSTHPDKEVITSRYLKRQTSLVRRALAQLVSDEEPEADDVAVVRADEEAAVERRISLGEQRTGAVVAALRAAEAHRIIDLGCGEGKLVRALLDHKEFDRIVGLDVSHRSLERAAERLRLEDMAPMKRARVELIHGSLTYRDKRMDGFDAATLIEVIEHLDPVRLESLGRVVFEFARPGCVIVTTPNVEYNVHFESLPAGRMRHRDHRFEWNRTEFRTWCDGVASRFGYAARYVPIGEDDPVTGPPTQMAIFDRAGGSR